LGQGGATRQNARRPWRGPPKHINGLTAIRGIPMKQRIIRWSALVVLLAHIALIAQAPPSRATELTRWAPNGPIHAVAVRGNTVYIGGNFWHIGPVTGSFAALSSDSATHDARLPYTNGIVGSI